jgi:hypothetical protein
MKTGVPATSKRSTERLEVAIDCAIGDKTHRSDDTEFVVAARGWSQCVSFGSFDLYRNRCLDHLAADDCGLLETRREEALKRQLESEAPLSLSQTYWQSPQTLRPKRPRKRKPRQGFRRRHPLPRPTRRRYRQYVIDCMSIMSCAAARARRSDSRIRKHDIMDMQSITYCLYRRLVGCTRYSWPFPILPARLY